MAYVKQTWVTGETITDAKLNHMEDGIASGGAFIVEDTITTSQGGEIVCVLNHTWQEIYDAAGSGLVIIRRYMEDEYAFERGYSLASVGYDGTYYVYNGNDRWESETTSGYPSYEEYNPNIVS